MENHTRTVAIGEFLVGDNADILADKQFQLLLLANAIGPLGTSLMSPVMDSLIEPFGTSTGSIGLMMSMYTAPAVVMIPIAGIIADRYGRRPVLIFGLLCFGIAGTAIALTKNFALVLSLRLFQGVGFAAIQPVIITSIGDLYTGAKEATGQGLRFTGSGLVQMVFPPIGGLLVVIAWQYPFLLHLLALPIVLAVYRWFEEPVDVRTPDRSLTTALRDQLRDLRFLIRQRRATMIVLARSTPSIVWLGFLTYNSILIVGVLGGTPTHAGVLAALASISYAVSAAQAGRVTSRFDNRLYPLISMNITVMIGTGIVFLAPSIPVAYVGICVMGLGFGVLLSMYRSIITDLAPTELRGGLVSLGESMGRLTGTMTPILMGIAISLATPVIGFELSLKLVGLSVGVIPALIGIACLVVLQRSPPIQSPIG